MTAKKPRHNRRPKFGRGVACEDSTSIRWLYYDPRTATLDVVFVSGERYRYDHVDTESVACVVFAESRGRAFQELIRDRFKFRKMRRPKMQVDFPPGEHPARYGAS